MRLEVIKLLMYVNRSFFSLMADWVPVINLRKNANVVLIPGVVYYPLLYHLKKKKKKESFLVFMHARTEFVNQMSRTMFSALKRSELLNHNS